MNIVDELLKIALLGSAWVLYLLILLSVASVGVVLERIWFFFRASRGGGEKLRGALLEALSAGDLDRAERLLIDSGTVEGKAVAEALRFREGGSKAVLDALDAEMAIARKELERGMVFLGTIGNNSPFIGLFGTVIGVIVAFHELGTAAARAGAMGNVMSGIAEALVATGVGIFVALPAVIAYNIAQKRIADIEQEAVSLGRVVAAYLETKERGGSVLTTQRRALPSPAASVPAASASVPAASESVRAASLALGGE